MTQDIEVKKPHSKAQGKSKAIKVKAPTGGVKSAPAHNLIAALDVGSSKICCFIAEVKSHGSIEVVGIGHQASKGVRAGVITDLRACETAVAHAVEAAELMARQKLGGEPLKSVFVNVPGTQCLTHNRHVDVRISGHDVSDRDMRAAMDHANTLAVSGKDELIHVIASGYSIDGQRGISEPRGMTGQNLGVSLTGVTALSPALRNLGTMAAQNRLEIDAFCASPYAAGLSTLVDDEMKLGCTVIDMGGGTTSVAVFMEGKLVFSAAIPVGGNHVTSDIARGLTTSLTDAERIKTLYGSTHASPSDDGAMIDVPPVGEEEHAMPNYVPRSLLTGIILPRIEETFELVRAKMTDAGVYQAAGRRVVLTGGASQLAGLCDVAQLILDKQVRLGRPQKIKGLAEATGGPAFATAAGLLIYAASHAEEIPQAREGYHFSLPANFNLPFALPFDGKVITKVTHWLKENW